MEASRCLPLGLGCHRARQANGMIRVVPGTNVLVSALLFEAGRLA